MTDRSEADRVSDDLVERVAKAMWMADIEPYDAADRIPLEQAPETAQAYCRAEARAAIALALEEAAKVVEIGYFSGEHAAAAIRAMIPKEDV